MGRKRKTTETSVETTELDNDLVEEIANELNNDTEETADEAEVINQFGLNAEEELKQQLIEEIEKSKEQEVVEKVYSPVSTYRLMIEIQGYVNEFDVSEETAVKLAQRLLGIGQSGKFDSKTISAFDFVSNKEDFLNDYRNARK